MTDKPLADTTLAVAEAVAAGAKTYREVQSAIASPSLQTVMFHARKAEEAGLVAMDRDENGKVRVRSLRPGPEMGGYDCPTCGTRINDKASDAEAGGRS